MGQGVRLLVTRARVVCERELKSSQEQSPPSLLEVEPLGVPEVGEVLMVSPHNKQLSGALQPVPPLLEHQDHSQKLLVSSIVKPATEEDTWMEFLVLPTPLRKDGPDSHVRGIQLHHELPTEVRVREDGRRREQALQPVECGFGFGSPTEAL